MKRNARKSGIQPSRRHFITAAAALPALAAGTALSQPVVTEAAETGAQESSDGRYRVSDHVRTYYRLSQF